MRIREWLLHPIVRRRDIFDLIEITQIRRQIILEKRSLYQVYAEWYRSVVASLPPGDAPILELGSGTGFLKQFLPSLITSDISYFPWLTAVVDGLRLPFGEKSLRGIVMVDVLHHISAVRSFFEEANRCLQPGGVVVMYEPWVTSWSRWVYSRLHFEPFCAEADRWEFPPVGPLAGANIALPWIVFERDRTTFEREFPLLQIQEIELTMPFRYLLTGGVTFRELAPSWSFALWRSLENLLTPWMTHFAMFAKIVLRREDC